MKLCARYSTNLFTCLRHDDVKRGQNAEAEAKILLSPYMRI